ncbi:hypothetical protein FRC10_008178 [Ceratobasidium sp. 414]|nr:hypothetical protein FRC10_008178 [Ceratobasidium sp. 414]
MRQFEDLKDPDADTGVLDPRLVDLNPTEEASKVVQVLDAVPEPEKFDQLRSLISEYICRFNNPEGDLLGIETAILILEAGILAIPDDKLKPILLNQLGDVYHSRFQDQGESRDIDLAINSKNHAISLLHDNLLLKRRWLNELAIFYEGRFHFEQDLSDIDMAIEHMTQAVSPVEEEPSSKTTRLNNLANLHHIRFQHLGDIMDIYTAIGLLHRVVKCASDADSDRHIWLRNLGVLHGLRFQHQNNQGDIDLAIHFQTQGASLIPDDDAAKPQWLNKLAKLYADRYDYMNDASDIDKAIEYHGRALSITPLEHPSRPAWLIDLGISHKSRFRRIGDLLDVNKSIEIQTEALSLMPEGNPAKPGCLCNLGIAYGTRYQRLGAPADINAAIDYQTQALALTPPEQIDPHQNILSNLGTSHSLRFEHLGNPADLEAAIEFLTQAMAIKYQNHVDKASVLNSLGAAYLRRFQSLGILTDLDLAIASLNESISITPDGAVSKPPRLDNLGIAYSFRFERLGKLEDLNRAVQLQTEAATLTPENQADKPERLNNVGGTYIRRFLYSGSISDIDSAIACLRQAVSLTPEGHVDTPIWLSTLGAAYTYRFRRQGDIGDIDAAIYFHEQTLALTPELHPERPARLNSLGTSHTNRFEHLGNLEDVNKAVNYLTRAVSLTPVGHPDQPIWLNNLTVTYRNRFQILDNTEDIDKAVELQTQVVSITPDGNSDKASWVHNLGGFHSFRFKRLANIEDLNRAIRLQTRAILLLPDTDAAKASWLNSLGALHGTRFRNQGEHSDLEMSLSCYKNAANSVAGYASSRLSAARNWAKGACSHESKLEAYQLMMSLIPRVVWLGNSVDHRWQYAAPISRMVTEAVAAAIEQQKYDLALEWLEEGRSIVWNQMLQLRSPFEQLHSAYADVAEELHQLARDIDRLGSSQPQDTGLLPEGLSQERAGRRHRRLAEDWDTLLDQARELPGFQDLLKPKKISELAQAAHSSTIVAVSVHETHCSALALRPGSTSATHIPLPLLSYTQCIEMQSQLFTSLGSTGLRGADRRPVFHATGPENHFEDILAILWTGVVQPVLDELGYLVGPLVFLPLHAAGLYDGPKAKIFNYVVSSYTPTLGALLKPRLGPNAFNGILAVGQAETPGCSPLPGTVAELDRIQEQAKGIRFTRSEGQDATPVSVLNGMRPHSWVHLACHAAQDTSDPTTSGFHLHGGRLDLATVIRESLENTELAFLSACQTATGDEGLPDEAVHLAAGMLMAGYRTVVATMWSIKDEDAPTVAEQFYKQLLQGGIADSQEPARALHGAVQYLRTRVGEREFTRWVPFIHMGR